MTGTQRVGEVSARIVTVFYTVFFLMLTSHILLPLQVRNSTLTRWTLWTRGLRTTTALSCTTAGQSVHDLLCLKGPNHCTVHNIVISAEQLWFYNNGWFHPLSLAFSKDKRKPTMVGVPDPNAVFGTATQMSQSDIDRVNLLYCRN